MKGSDRLERLSLPALLLLMLAMVAAGFAYLVIQERANDRAMMLYNGGQAVAEASVMFMMQGSLSVGELPKGLGAFGVYKSGGEAIARYGAAPASLSARLAGESDSAILSGASVTIVRQLGGPGLATHRFMGGAGYPGLMQGFPLGPSQGAPWGQPRGSPADGLTLYGVYSSPGELAVQDIREAILIGAALLFFLLAFVVYALYRRLMKYRVERINQRRMVELGEAARTIAHEIKNPLGAIRVRQAILERLAPAELQDSVSVIAEEVTRMASLTDRVREFLRNPIGDTQILDLPGFVRELAARQEFPIKVTTPDAACLVKIDPERMRSIATNLLQNAWESMHAQGGYMTPGREEPVEVAIEDTGRKRVRLSVRDRGCGIPPADIEHVFDPFFTTKQRGSGVGLAVTKHFVEGAGGTIVVSNRPHGGTEVIVELPREA